MNTVLFSARAIRLKFCDARETIQGSFDISAHDRVSCFVIRAEARWE